MDNIKVGDKVLVKAEIVEIQENSQYGKYEVSVASFDYAMLSKQRIYVNDVLTKSYEDGLNDSWELAKKIINSAEMSSTLRDSLNSKMLSTCTFFILAIQMPIMVTVKSPDSCATSLDKA